jgi:hypothetical protein
MELVNPREKDFITETVSIPRRYHRTLLGEKAIFIHDIEAKTNSSFRFPNKETASDTIHIFGPESQIHIAAQMLLVHIPFEADFRVPNSELLKEVADGEDLHQLLDRVKHDLNITVVTMLRPEAKESVFRFCLNRSNVDFLPTARDILEDFLVSKKVRSYQMLVATLLTQLQIELPPGSIRPRTEARPTDPFQHFNSALLSTAARASGNGQSSPTEAKNGFAPPGPGLDEEPPRSGSSAGFPASVGFYNQSNGVHSPRPLTAGQHHGYSGYYQAPAHYPSPAPSPMQMNGPMGGRYDYATQSHTFPSYAMNQAGAAGYGLREGPYPNQLHSSISQHPQSMSPSMGQHPAPMSHHPGAMGLQQVHPHTGNGFPGYADGMLRMNTPFSNHRKHASHVCALSHGPASVNSAQALTLSTI